VLVFSNPKRSKANAGLKESWFDYYAGFSSAFVRTALEQLVPDMKGDVLDPWNGSGTTTTTAHELGVCSTGIDINPVMAVVAKAKLVTSGVQDSLVPLAEDIVAKSRATLCKLCPDDPLLEWFSPSGAQGIRGLEQAIRKLLTPLQPSEPLSTANALNAVSDLAAFYMVALFRTTRSFVGRFNASNPTWIKSPKTAQERVRPKAGTTSEAFLQHISDMIEGIVPVDRDTNTTITLGSSERLPLPSASVQAVIASPPYCTRIDYAVATKPEFAVLGCPLHSDFEALRHRMMGGPVVLREQPRPKNSWGPACLRLLSQVRTHRTKGSKNYYYKLFVQYYGSLHRSLQEIDRTLVPNGHCVLVVQDSHYKEIHVDVARYITEMALDMGWSLKQRLDFETQLVMARLNPKVQKYRTHAGATESVLWFRTAS
jgi:hypothetical protein